MARTLSITMDAANLANATRAWKFYVYDIITASQAIGDVVVGNANDARQDFSDNVESITVTETGSNSLDGTLGGSSLQFTFLDPENVYDPVEGTTPRWLKAGNVIQLVEGFVGVSESDWITTFTGTIVGRAARTNSLRTDGSILTVSAEDRVASFVKYADTSSSFAQNTDYNSVLDTILTEKMGLSVLEYDIGVTGATATTGQISTQFVDEPMLVSVNRILFKFGFVPRFAGDGTLGVVQMTVDKGADRVYVDDDLFVDISRPANPLSAINRVTVIGLAADMTRIDQAAGRVADAGITQGFFSGNASIRVPFSDDESIFVDNPKLRIIKSIRGGIVPFGAEETLEVTAVDTQDGATGATSGVIKVDGAFYAPLVTSLFAGRLAASFIPDAWGGVGGGPTTPIGRLIEGVISVNIALIQAQIGTGQYEIEGEPYEYVFEELRGVAEISGIATVDRREALIENHLLDDQAEVNAVALRELRLVRKRSNEMSVSMKHDLVLEADDKFTRSNGRSYIITSISRTVKRGGEALARIACFETTFGASP